MPAPIPGDPDYPADEWPLDEVERALERLQETWPERKRRRAEFLATIEVAESDPNVWDDAVAFEIGRSDDQE